AQVVLPRSDPDRGAAEIIGPDCRQEARDDAVARRLDALQIVEPQQHGAPAIGVIEGIPVVGALPWVQHEPLRLLVADELDGLALALATDPRHDRVGVAELDRHPAVAESLNRHCGPPSAVSHLPALYLADLVIDQRRAVQPLAD